MHKKAKDMAEIQRSEKEAANLALGEKFYTAIFAGDWDTIAANVTDDFVVVEADSMPYGGTWKGVEGFQKLFAEMSSVHFDNMKIQRKAMTASDDYLMLYFVLTGNVRKNGKLLSVEIADWHVATRCSSPCRQWWRRGNTPLYSPVLGREPALGARFCTDSR